MVSFAALRIDETFDATFHAPEQRVVFGEGRCPRAENEIEKPEGQRDAIENFVPGARGHHLRRASEGRGEDECNR